MRYYSIDILSPKASPEKKALLRHRHRQAVDRLRELIFLPDEEASPEIIREMEALNDEVGLLTGRLPEGGC